MLCDAGHEVTWWTASFSHRFKRPIEQGATAAVDGDQSLRIRIVDTPSYTRNVSLQRIRSHRTYANRFESDAQKHEPPDVIIASNPPPDATAAAARIAAAAGARLIVDVQDIWVENFRRMLPRFVRWSWPAVLHRWIRDNRTAYRQASAVVGVAERYADEPLRYARREYERRVIPIGIDLASFDASARRGRSVLPPRTPGEVRVIYSGSLSRSYDIATVVRAAKQVTATHPELRVILAGTGHLEAEVRRLVEGCRNIHFTGFLGFDDWAATMKECDIGWNAVRGETLILLPNKVFDYWAAGHAVLSGIPGECADWIARSHTGISYKSGDTEAAVRALTDLISDPRELQARRRASRRLAEEQWDRARLYRPYVALVGGLADREKTTLNFYGPDRARQHMPRSVRQYASH
jgi:glycosyltransferase involved in cell wall biosynthesis